jgi:mercuric ion transport protein
MTDSPSPILDSDGVPERKNLSVKLMVLAVVSSLVASTCCLLPLALVLAGITGVWMTTLTALEPVTPLFNGIAVAALIWAGYLIFRPARVSASEQGQACDPGARRLTKRIFLGCALFIGLLLIFPLFAPLFY